MNATKSILVRPYLTSELSVLYKVSYPTMRKWLDSIEDRVGNRIGKYYSVKQVGKIFDHFGVPFNYEFSSENKVNF
jgi:hypothetical protein